MLRIGFKRREISFCENGRSIFWTNALIVTTQLIRFVGWHAIALLVLDRSSKHFVVLWRRASCTVKRAWWQLISRERNGDQQIPPTPKQSFWYGQTPSMFQRKICKMKKLKNFKRCGINNFVTHSCNGKCMEKQCFKKTDAFLLNFVRALATE